MVNPDSDTLTLIDTNTRAVLKEIAVGDDPRAVAIAGSTAYVTNHGSDSISLIDLATHNRITDIPVGDRPVGVAVSPGGRFLAISELGQDTVTILETNSLKHLISYPVADRPYGLSFTPDNRSLLITHLLSGEITRIPVSPYTSYLPTISFGSIITPSPEEMRGNEMTTGSFPDGLVTGIHTWTNIAPAPGVLVNFSGTRAYLPQTMGNGQGLNTQFDTTVFPLVSVIDLESILHLKSENISLPDIDRPVGLPWDAVLTHNEHQLWVVNAASNDVSVIDISNPIFPIRRANIKVSHNPRSIILNLDGTTAYVHNTLAGTISVIDTESYSVEEEIITTSIPLPPLLLEGKRLFHTSSRPELAQAAWISCNTCHIEGEHDGRTWFVQFLGEVPPGEQSIIKRNTTSLLGMVETYPLRWSAEWDESADSEFSIRFEQFGTGLITGEMHPTLGTPNQGRSSDLDSLAAFLDSLEVPARAQPLSPAAKRGKQVFESPQTNCIACHPPPLYTDLSHHDVGTGDTHGEWFGPEFDTPTLRFLFDSAPYLHDGSSPTLRHVLTDANNQDDHGITSHLNDQQIDDLIAFLVALPYQ